MDCRIFYHGARTKFRKFDYNFVGTGSGADQEGPGFYLTSDRNDAAKYSWREDGKPGYIYEVRCCGRKLVPESGRVDRGELKRLIEMAVTWRDEEGWANWGDTPSEGLKTCLSFYTKETPQQAFQSVWYDHYLYNPADYLRNMVILGYDGVLIKNGYRSQNSPIHFIGFDPDKLEILQGWEYLPS
jgi:hypothetical protein